MKMKTESPHARLATLTYLLLALTLACALPGGSAQPTTPPEPPPATQAPGETPGEPPIEASPTGPVVHILAPAEFYGMDRFINDTVCEVTGDQGRAPGGDQIEINRYERPFVANTMQYLPFLDIKRAELNHEAPWIYIALWLVAPPSQLGALTPLYGVEIDVDIDGRGDFLVWGSVPTSSVWTTDGVQVWMDANDDVGALNPLEPDAPAISSGYETSIFNAGRGNDPDGAWIRLGAGGGGDIQLAIKESLLGAPPTFMWNAWTDAGLQQPGWFDYNDHFTSAEAGSPLVELKALYPIKSIFAVDNTCREAFGFTPGGTEPGVCQQVRPPATGCLQCYTTGPTIICGCLVPCPVGANPGTPCSP
jgi:hypothetical protein